MATKINKHKRNTNGFTLLGIMGWILLVAVICFGVLVGWKLFQDDNTKSDASESSRTQDINTADVDNKPQESTEPKEEQDNKTTAGNEAKAKTDELEKQQAAEAEKTDGGLKKADVVLNEPYWVEDKLIISSVVTNIHENEGDNCYYILSSETSTTTIVRKVMPNAKNTVCKALEIEKGSLTPGRWSVKLKYKSNYAEGVSETQTFTIQ